MNETRGNRLHISVFGRCNVGKSSLLNRITNQTMSIVSDLSGTTTDAVQKSMEFLPLGPCVFIDTAGIDDNSSLGKLRVEKTFDIMFKTDVAIVVCDYEGFSDFEKELCRKLKHSKIPFFIIVNKNDVKEIEKAKYEELLLFSNNIIKLSAKQDKNLALKIKDMLINVVDDKTLEIPSALDGVVDKDDVCIMVVPIDKEAPKGRLILPQVQTIRCALDKQAQVVVVQQDSLKKALDNLKKSPKIVITDSQAFEYVDSVVPKDIFLTSFSILFSRIKGDLRTFYRSAKSIDSLDEGDRILIYESCTHHPIEDDIARVKIPAWLKKATGIKNLYFDYHSSSGFEKNIEKYSLIIQCGGCMTNRREILSRINFAIENHVPITNYGLAIAHCLGILPRAVEIFKNEIYE